MLYTSLASSWPRVTTLHLVPKIESAFEVDYIFGEWCMLACFAAPRSMALLRLVHVCVFDWSSTTGLCLQHYQASRINTYRAIGLHRVKTLHQQKKGSSMWVYPLDRGVALTHIAQGSEILNITHPFLLCPSCTPRKDVAKLLLLEDD